MTKDTKIAKKSSKTEVAKVDKKAAPAKVEKKDNKKAAKKVESSSESESESSEEESSEESSEEESEEEKKSESESESSEEESEEEMVDHKRKREEEAAAPSKAAKTEATSEETNCFVGGLPFSATEEEVKAFFAECGEIKEVRLISDRQTGRAKGFGYIDFATAAGAQAALKFNEADFQGRYLRVDLAGAKPVPTNNHAGPSEKPPSKTVFIGGLSFNSTVESLTEAFGECGDLKEVRICKDQDGNSRGFGYAEFETVEAATKACEYNETELDGRQIRVNFADDKPAGGGGFGGGRGGRGGFGGGRGGGRGGFGGDRGGRGGFGGGRGGFGGGRGGGRGGFGGDRGGRGGFGGGRGGFGGGRGGFAGNHQKF